LLHGQLEYAVPFPGEQAAWNAAFRFREIRRSRCFLQEVEALLRARPRVLAVEGSPSAKTRLDLVDPVQELPVWIFELPQGVLARVMFNKRGQE